MIKIDLNTSISKFLCILNATIRAGGTTFLCEVFPKRALQCSPYLTRALGPEGSLRPGVEEGENLV